MNFKRLKNNNHFFILTGGPGVGKTSVIDYLQNKNMRCFKEVARGIIKEQLQNDGEALPWRNKDLMLDFSVKDYIKVINQDKEITFFDRGIPDTLAYAHLENLPISKNLQFYAEKYQYNTKVFIFPPWKEIYKTDNERKQQFDEVIRTHETMIQTYQNCGYKTIMMPQESVENRGEFILNCINN